MRSELDQSSRHGDLGLVRTASRANGILMGVSRIVFAYVCAFGVASAQEPAAPEWGLVESVERLVDPGSRAEAIAQLVAHGAASVPVLAALLETQPIGSDEVDVHRAALSAIGRLKRDAVSARPVLLHIVREGHSHLAEGAMAALEDVWIHDPAFLSSGEKDLEDMVACAERDGVDGVRLERLRCVRRRLLVLYRGRVAPEFARGVLALLGSRVTKGRLFEVFLEGDRAEVSILLSDLERQLTFPFPRRPGVDNPRGLELNCAEAILALDPDGLEASIAWSYLLCYHPDPERRLAAARSLRCLPHVGVRGVADAVLAACEDRGPGISLEALPLVSVHCLDGSRAIPVLERLVTSDRPRVAGLAASVLRGFDR